MDVDLDAVADTVAEIRIAINIFKELDSQVQGKIKYTILAEARGFDGAGKEKYYLQLQPCAPPERFNAYIGFPTSKRSDEVWGLGSSDVMRRLRRASKKAFNCYGQQREGSEVIRIRNALGPVD